MSEDVRVQCRCGAFHEPDDPCPACGRKPGQGGHADVEALAQRMADADPKVQIDFLLRVASEVTVERDRLRDEVTGWRAENDRHRALYIEAVKERDRLRVVMDAARASLTSIEDRLRDRAMTLSSHSEQVAADEALLAAGDIAAVLDELDSETPPVQRILADYAKDLEAERERLQAVVDAVSVMWDNVVHANPEGTLMGFPLSDYDTLERALDALDVIPTGEDT